MMLDYNIEFPCGYKIRLYLRQWFSQTAISDKDLPTCPLHGKDCRSKSTKLHKKEENKK